MKPPSIKNRRGRYIVLEGIRSSGKTTQRDLLDGRLQAAGIPVRFVREPAGDAVGRAIRKIFLDSQFEIDARTEIFLMNAARASLMRQLCPLLEQGVWVVCLRSFLTTLAYQGAGRQADITTEQIRTLCELATSGLSIDLGVLLDGPPENFERRQRRRPPGTRIDSLDRDFMTRARQSYLTEASIYGFEILDATRPIIATEQDIWRLLEPHIKDYLAAT